MQPKPDDFNIRNAEAFKDQQVVDAYRYRAPYPPEVFTILESLITDTPRVLLDVGAGSGDIARQCVDFVERVDAVDFSQTMIIRGKQLPHGNDPRLHWIYGKVEEVPLTPPYALITAGASIHWTQWEIAFPRFRSLLAPHGYLALVTRRELPMPWKDELKKLRAEYSTRGEPRASVALGELEARHLFERKGQQETAAIPFTQSLADFIEGLHSRSAFSRERMSMEDANTFDQRVRDLVLTYYPDGQIPMQVIGTVTWGLPLDGNSK